jgi:Cys-tRNA(Pro)/Cys-tRNA(Cys) deacylase
LSATDDHNGAVAGTPALDVVIRSKIVHTVLTYVHDANAASFGEEAAAALGLEPTRVFKTLVVRADDSLAVALVPVDQALDMKALARILGTKRAQMADPETAERSSGYVVGGISPLGQKHRLTTVIDQSASEFATIFVSGGRRGVEIELAPGDLATLTTGRFAAIARGPSRAS